MGKYWSEYTLYPTVMSSNFPSNKGGLVACEDSAENAPNKSLLAIEASTSGTDTPKDDPYRNLRLWPGDGVNVLPKFPELSIASLLLTFPDPFPEDREAEWRVVQLSTLEEIYRTLRKTPSRPGRFFLQLTTRDTKNGALSVSSFSIRMGSCLNRSNLVQIDWSGSRL